MRHAAIAGRRKTKAQRRTKARIIRETCFPTQPPSIHFCTIYVRTSECPSKPRSMTAAKYRIAIGSDHAGYRYKTIIVDMLRDAGHDITDMGTDSDEAVDYPLFVRPVAEAVARGEYDRGIVLGGSGNGEAIVANRVRGVRCTLCWNVESARLGRAHNNANVLSLGERMVSVDEMRAIVNAWLETPFEGGRHERRIREIDEY